MSDQPVLTKPHNAAEIRAELEAMVVGDLFGTAGGGSEELTEHTVRDRYIVGICSPSRASTPFDTVTGEDNKETPLSPDKLTADGIERINGRVSSSTGMMFYVNADAKQEPKLFD